MFPGNRHFFILKYDWFNHLIRLKHLAVDFMLKCKLFLLLHLLSGTSLFLFQGMGGGEWEGGGGSHIYASHKLEFKFKSCAHVLRMMSHLKRVQ